MQATGTSSVSLGTMGGGGRGGGLGSGVGNGVGPGTGGGFGGGAFRPGSGISNPVPLVKPTPLYTPEAMRMKVMGTVDVEARVEADGTVSDVRVARSLDKAYGMDEAALKAARQWVFKPALDRDGKPVPVIVTLQFDLRLH
jgi:TonB family protein